MRVTKKGDNFSELDAPLAISFTIKILFNRLRISFSVGRLRLRNLSKPSVIKTLKCDFLGLRGSEKVFLLFTAAEKYKKTTFGIREEQTENITRFPVRIHIDYDRLTKKEN